ncbi:MAG: ABC transporter permease subunit [Planctomycetes bacterium]|nr:ABC transporter permease subunit [Planctomycetota bacterium]
MLAGGGTMLYLAARDGTCERFDLRDLDRIALAEHVDLVDDPRPELASLRFVLGRTTLLAGDSAGRLDAWFPTKPDGATTVDGATLVRAHELARGAQAVAATASSQRSRVVAVGFADGAIELFNVTSSKDLGRVDAGAPIRALALAPREDGLVAWTDRGLRAWDLELGHTEATVAALFRPVWYEGYERPEQVWQSTSGGDDFEPKLGLWPLVFGTLKATFYSLLFGVPLAILAALFSSEFLTPRVRVPIKSTVEIMAGLPSVVLGFLAAIIFAPFVQSVVPAVLVGFVAIPFALLCGAHAWQLLPQRIALRFADWRRFLCIVAMIPLGVALSAWAGPWVECWFFGGDLEVWLSGRDGSAVGGWMLLFLPLSALVVAFANGRVLMPWLRGRSVAWKRAQCARADFARFAFNACATVALALVLSAVVSAAGFDARGSYVDTFVQRNALVVGFVMGFAIIPIIYTIAEDALSSVPEHLRLASLAAGATPWQTAVRVILPTAASGLFSAVMVGLGRAVGETMIVLMATGNTAVLDWNMFSGFRTLSANIATELPEAVRNSTHYRTLFLAALVLFAMTFAVNTAAEVVRQRFRKRAFQL